MVRSGVRTSLYETPRQADRCHCRSPTKTGTSWTARRTTSWTSRPSHLPRTSGRWCSTTRRAADVSAVPQQEQQEGQAHRQRRWLGRYLLRPHRPAGKGSELDRDGPEQGLVHPPAPLRPARTVVRQDLAAGWDRRGEV